MPKPKDVKWIVIHCTAGHGDVTSIQNFWKNTLGWKNPGYHRIIDKDGTIHKISEYENITNGVRGFNQNAIHIAYIGGVEEKNVNKAKDTRTAKQKLMIQHCISDILLWLEKNEVAVDENINVVGHRDFSPDKDNSGIIEPWERIKECPSFDAIPEYSLWSSENVRNKLPKK